MVWKLWFGVVFYGPVQLGVFWYGCFGSVWLSAALWGLVWLGLDEAVRWSLVKLGKARFGLVGSGSFGVQSCG